MSTETGHAAELDVQAATDGQHLRRVLNLFETAVFGIAYQGPTAGCFFLLPVTLVVMGPAMIWSIPILYVGQMVLMLIFAELVSAYPLEGGIYQWARMVSTEFIGFITGLIYLVALFVIPATIGVVLTVLLNGIAPSTFSASTSAQVVTAICLSAGTFALMSLSTRMVAVLNSIGVAMELVVLWGASLLLLIFHRHQSVSVVGHTYGALGNHTVAYGILVCVGLLGGTLTGAETAGIFAEESKGDRREPGKAMMLACTAGCVSVGLFTFAALMATKNIHAAIANPQEWLVSVLTAAFGTAGVKVFLVAACFTVISTSIAIQSAAGRIIYGMAREGKLPGRRVLTKLNRRSGQPLFAVGVAALLGLLPLLYISKTAVLGAAIAGMFVVPYAVTVVGVIRRRRHVGDVARAENGFSLGGFQLPVMILGLLWTLLLLVILFWPRDITNPKLGPFRVLWEVLVVMVVLGVLLWVFRSRSPSVEGTPAAAD
jgi:amino acid transporter